ncbi:MAG: mercury resistance system periplasmic binding protein MerP [Hydrogenophilales bacterium]|nr:mercury resistance system periplasmic binding protein MerP [Hydrogenophilales bacterium]
MKKIVSFLVVPFIGLVLFSSSALAVVQTVTFSVPGMYCAVCPITVKKALQKVAGVTKVDVSFEKKEAVVTFDDAKASVNKLLDATFEAGYPAEIKRGNAK